MVDEDFVVTFDGACSGNPGPASCAAVASNGAAEAWFIGLATNNIAEFQGLRCAIRIALASGEREALIRGDSQLVINAMAGVFRISNPELVRLVGLARQEMAQDPDIDFAFEYVPRALNNEADRLAEKALQEGLLTPREDWPTWHVKTDPQLSLGG